MAAISDSDADDRTDLSIVDSVWVGNCGVLVEFVVSLPPLLEHNLFQLRKGAILRAD